MPEADSGRKRSRSPSDSDTPKQYKRANTGTAAISDEGSSGASSVPQATLTDVNMADVTSAEDNAGSTPDSNHDQSKLVKSEDEKSSLHLGKANSANTSGEPSSPSEAAPAPSANIHMRCLIVTQDASIIIGKGGSHVNEIREKSGARVMVSESIPGNPERILNVSGPLDAVSKVGTYFFVMREHFLNQVTGIWPYRSSN